MDVPPSVSEFCCPPFSWVGRPLSFTPVRLGDGRSQGRHDILRGHWQCCQRHVKHSGFYFAYALLHVPAVAS